MRLEHRGENSLCFSTLQSINNKDIQYLPCASHSPALTHSMYSLAHVFKTSYDLFLDSVLSKDVPITKLSLKGGNLQDSKLVR